MGNAHGKWSTNALRDPVAAAFTAHRTAALRPRIERWTAELLDTVAAQPDNEPVDLRKLLAHPLPVTVISELFGVPDQLRPRLRRTVDVSFDTGATPRQINASIAEMFGLLNELVAINATTGRGPDHRADQRERPGQRHLTRQSWSTPCR